MRAFLLLHSASENERSKKKTLTQTLSRKRERAQ
ncbi:MAG: hypothetical protein JWR77_911 [Rhizorhabdus sp.]|nr:hypothetical protein [Rhizorhabdus sp.]